jgi:hypothetical protein
MAALAGNGTWHPSGEWTEGTEDRASDHVPERAAPGFPEGLGTAGARKAGKEGGW